MNRYKMIVTGVLAGLLLVAAGCGMFGRKKKLTFGPQIGHMVFFTLQDNSVYAKQQLVRDCSAYLRKHAGVVYFSAGERAEMMSREVNVKDFDVALHIIFENTEAYDAYQVSKKHLEFIDRNEANWKQVRVFDSLVK